MACLHILKELPVGGAGRPRGAYLTPNKGAVNDFFVLFCGVVGPKRQRRKLVGQRQQVPVALAATHEEVATMQRRRGV